MFLLLSIKIEVFLVNSCSSLIQAFHVMDYRSKNRFFIWENSTKTSKELSFVLWWCWWGFVGASITEEDAGFELHVAMSSTLAVIVITTQRYSCSTPSVFFFLGFISKILSFFLLSDMGLTHQSMLSKPLDRHELVRQDVEHVSFQLYCRFPHCLRCCCDINTKWWWYGFFIVMPFQVVCSVCDTEQPVCI